MGRKPLSQEQRDLTRQKLFETSNRMIAEGGMEHLNIRSLCKEVGISYSSFYDYYKNKDELIASKAGALDRFFLKNEECLQDADTMVNIKNFIQLYCEFAATRNIEIIREVYRMQMYGDLKEAYDQNRPMVTILHRILAQGVEQKQLPENTDLAAAQRMIFSLCRGIVMDWCACGGSYPIQDYGRAAAELFAIRL